MLFSFKKELSMGLNNPQVFTMNYGGKEIKVETGRLAKQADASVLVSSAGTQVLVTVCSAKTMKDGQDFFPLLVDYTEKFYAAGKFLGGFMKREGRPSTQETLNSRLIDRPLRPLFPEGYMFETVIQATVLSYNSAGDPEVLAALGASAALCISDIPFNGPLGTCKVGRVNGELVLNPSYDQWENSELELVVAATKDAIMMVEGEGEEVAEAEMLDALDFAHNNIREFCNLMDEMVAKVGREKRPFESASANTALIEKVQGKYADQVNTILKIDPKLERQNAVAALIEEVKNDFSENFQGWGLAEDASFSKEAAKTVDEVLYNVMRADILDNNRRIGDRGMDAVRAIETEVDVLETPHGSSLFTRGETQVLATVTLGGASGEQMADTMKGLSYNNFYLHYAFPPFSVGEARGVRGVGRRELGHGNLAERAVKGVIQHDKFPYTIRVMCEVLESNGSSSMGSVCSASMAMMDAGVPLKGAVAGVAMGLIKDGEKYKILTDILGDEDHLGDMDFKVAGTEKGITAIQMDIKIEGITREIFTQAMEQARAGRLHILAEMSKTISDTRKDLKGNAPKMKTMQIPQDKIGLLIGPGGKNIKALQADFDITVEIDDSGLVKLSAVNGESLDEAMELIDLQLNGPAIGKDYDGKVVTIKDYGAFVDIASGVSGLLHVSELADERVQDVNDYLSEGDSIKVRVLEVDRFGKMKLSAKAIKPLEKKN
jgi:polyribonucleotide nucleotidyltransferase